MKQMRRMATAGAAALVAAAAIGCGSGDGESDASGTATTAAGGDEQRLVAYVAPVDSSQPGQQQALAGLRSTASELGWEARVLDANLSPDRQVSHVDTLVSQGADAFTIWTLDPGAAGGALTRAQEAGVRVIGLNSTGTGVESTIWWEVNTCEPGGPAAQTAERIAQSRPGGRVLVMGGPPAPAIVANVRCFRDAAERAGLAIVDQADNIRDTSAAAAQLAEDLLTKHGELDAIWTYADQTALGVSSALLNAGRRISDGDSEGVMVFGINGDPDAIQAVREGRLTGTWDTDAPATGFAMARAMRDAIAGAPADMTVASRLWTSENVGEYQEPEERGYTVDELPLLKPEGGS